MTWTGQNSRLLTGVSLACRPLLPRTPDRPGCSAGWVALRTMAPPSAAAPGVGVGAPPRRWWHGAALPALLAALLFVRTLRADFTFDDRVAVKENMDVIDARRPWSRMLRNDFWGSPAHFDTSNKSYRRVGVMAATCVRA